MSSIKKTMSALLAVGMLAASAVTAAAENAEPTMPDLTGQRYLTIDEISPGTSVRSFSETVKLSENEEMRIYNDDGIRLFAGDYIGNGASVIIFENSDIKEVYRIKLYGDLNGDGLINAADIAEMRKTAMSLGAPDDRTVSDIDVDGETNIIDLIKLKKYRAGICELSQGRMLAASSRFTNRAVSSVEGYEESFEDLSAASKDIELTFGRYYNSEETDGNMLGGGWTASFEGCVSLSNGSATVRIYGRAPLAFKYENGKYSSSSSRARLENSSGGFVFTDESGIKYTFGTAGFLVKITDKNGNNTEIGVNSAGKIQKVTDSVGREYLYAYNESGRLSSVTDCMQRTVGYTYNEDGRLSSVIGVLGTVTESYLYNADGRLVRISDAFGNRMTGIDYDESRNVASVTDSDGVKTEYSYDTADNSVTLSRNNEITERRVYNRYGYQTASETADGTQRTYYCNAYGDIALTEDNDGNKTFYVHDLRGNILKTETVTDEGTETETNRYDESGNLIKSVSKDSAAEYTYDGSGNVLTVKKTAEDKQEETTVYTYNPDGTVSTAVTDGKVSAYTYNENGYLTREEADGAVKAYTYNSVGWQTSETADGKTVSYSYNLNGDKIRTAENNTVKSRTVYDNYGRIKQQISEAEYNASFDALNTSSADSYTDTAAGIRYYYGTDGRLTQIKAGCYAVSANADNRVTSVTAGNTVLAQYDYDNDAQSLISAVNYANGQSIAYNYNSAGNIESLYYGDTLAYTYAYDSGNTLVSKTNHIDNVRTVYSSDGVTVGTINSDGTLNAEYNRIYERLNRTSSTSGMITTDGFEPAADGEEAELKRITESFAGSSFSTDYYEDYLTYGGMTRTEEKTDGTVSGVTVKNGGNKLYSEEYTYNDDGLIATFAVSDGRTYAYTYDENKNIISVVKTQKTAADSGSQSSGGGKLGGELFGELRYYYDSLGQLIRTDDEENERTTEYIYDGNGNITAVKTYSLHEKDEPLSSPISAKSFGYSSDGWTDMLTSYDGSAVTHDALGNILSFNGYTYTWQAGRRLAGMTNGTNTYGYKYDDNGIRTEKTVNGVTTHYLTVDGRITGQYDGTDTLYFRYNADNSPIGFSLNGEEYLYLKNIQGDVEEIVDKNGNSVVKYAYNEWGKLLSVTGSMAAAVGRINPIRYRGYYYDGETGYYYLQSRYYNPDICRFINADEPDTVSAVIDKEANANLFAYCKNSPVNLNDSSGKWSSIYSYWAVNYYRFRFRRAFSNFLYNKANDIKWGFINGQELGKVSRLKYGLFRMAYNGCEVIAVYNALQLKGKGLPISLVAFEMEINGSSMLYGVFGSNPHFIGNYLYFHKIRYTKATSVNAMKKLIRNNGVYIITFWTGRAYRTSIHTIAFKYRNGIYTVYNDSNRNPKEKTRYSLSSIYSNGVFIMGYYLY